MDKTVWNRGIRSTTFDHHASERNSNITNSAFNNTVLVMTITRAELMLDPLCPTVVDPSVGGINKFIIRFDESNLVGVMAILEKDLKFFPLVEGFGFVFQQVQVAHSAMVVNIELKRLLASLSESDINMDTFIDSRGPMWAQF